MKSVNLLFVPGANTTYLPLGIASLYSYIRTYLPTCDIYARDLSIALWNNLAAEDPSLLLAVRFFQGQVGNFYNESLYKSYRENIQPLYQSMKTLEQEIHLWLNTGEESPGLALFRHFILDEIGGKPRDLTALSAMYPDQIPFLAAIAKILKDEFPAMTIIAGGAAFSAIDIDEIAKALPEVAIFYRGEGEEGFASLIRSEDPITIPGVCINTSEGVQTNGKPSAIVMDSLPIPDFSFCRLNEYHSPEPVLPVVFSRGCRWRQCGFCSHNFSFTGYRTLEAERFVTTLAHYRQQGIRSFYFADQYIGADDLEAISWEILDRGLDIRFHVMGRPTKDYTLERLKLSFSAGCRWISWGVESGSQHLLDICRKGTSIEEVTEVLTHTAEAGISNLAMMIYGMPTSNQETFNETIEFCNVLSARVDAFTASSFQLFEGTPFWVKREALQLDITEREVLLTIGNKHIHSNRWGYYFLDGNECRIIPPGPSEVDQWKRWAVWVRGGETFFETLASEHYLLFAIKKADHIHIQRNRPQRRPRGVA